MWYYIHHLTNNGPYSDEQMAQLIRDGQVARQSLVWSEGMQEWKQAAQTQLAFYFPPEVHPVPSLSTAGPVVTVVEDPVVRERNRKMNYWSLIGMGWMFGVIVLFMGLQLSGERKATEGPPVSMTLAELAANGPADNTYIELTHLKFGEQFLIVKDRNTGIWKDVWAFLFTENDPHRPIVVVNIDGGGENAMTKWMSEKKVTGLIEIRPRFATSTYGKELYAMYPNVKPDQVKWYLKAVYGRPSENRVNFTYAAGVACIVAGHLLALIFYGNRKAKARLT
jgi:hypothetical protein